MRHNARASHAAGVRGVRVGVHAATAVAAAMKDKFELAPQVVVLETGTLAREFEANVKAARFIDRRTP